MDKSPIACEDEDDLDLHRAHKQNCSFSQGQTQVLLRFITDMKLCLMSLNTDHQRPYTEINEEHFREVKNKYN